MNWDRVTERIESFIINFVNSSQSEGVVIGLSGGVDSSTVAYLCVKALGNERVFGLIMPERGVTPEEDVRDAIEIAEKLGIKYKIIEINEILNAFLESADGERKGLALANLKPRIRMILNYYHANSMNRVVAGTGNKSELMIGYFTKYGDGGVDFLPIGDLYKTEVFRLASYIGVPERIVKKKPSAGLWRGQTDEGELGITYQELDEILKAIEKGEKREDEKFVKVLELVERTKHKRETPPVAKVRDLL
ncbi:NAD+ synthase [Archaeoglobus neptunius]|uniref:NAD+ synthase n=1 Tax=Archaeoglobus neptunius TaxID=2798580 RepID=UPI0019290A3A|nr:NAD+ synthase [Archaeoglobus neptunius]